MKKGKFCFPLISLFLSPEDFPDAFCIAGGGAFGRPWQSESNGNKKVSVTKWTLCHKSLVAYVYDESTAFGNFVNPLALHFTVAFTQITHHNRLIVNPNHVHSHTPIVDLAVF